MTYKQSTGEVFNSAGKLLGVGHAGNGLGLNNPAMQFVHNVGPLPRGHYKLAPWVMEPRPAPLDKLGPITAELIPQPDEDGSLAWLQGRGGFYFHGPVFSEGCPVQEHDVRLAMSKNGDMDLIVIF